MILGLSGATGSLCGVACALKALPDGVLIKLAASLPLPDRLHLAQTSKSIRCRLLEDEGLWNCIGIIAYDKWGHVPSRLRSASTFLRAHAPSGCHVGVYMIEGNPDPVIWHIIGDELLPLVKTLRIYIDYQHYDRRAIHDPQVVVAEGFVDTVMNRVLRQPFGALQTLSIHSGSSDECSKVIYLPDPFLGGSAASGSLRNLRLEEIRMSVSLNYTALSSVVRFDYIGGWHGVLPPSELQAITHLMPQLEELGLSFGRLEQAPPAPLPQGALREVWIFNFDGGSSGILAGYFHLVPTVTIKPLTNTTDPDILQWPSSTFDLTVNPTGNLTIRTSQSYHQRVTIHLSDLERATSWTQRSRIVSITFGELLNSTCFPLLCPLPGVTLLRIVVSPCQTELYHLCSVLVSPSLLGKTLQLFPALDRIEIIHNTTKSRATSGGCKLSPEGVWRADGGCCCSTAAIISLSVLADFLCAIIPQGRRIGLLRLVGMDYITDGDVVDALRRLAEMVDIVEGAAHDIGTERIVNDINMQVLEVTLIHTNLEQSLNDIFANSWLG